MTALANYEFHRRGIGLVPASGQGHEGSAIYVELAGGERPLRSCTCKTSRRRTCSHLKELAKGIDAFHRRYSGRSWNDVFAETVWYRLARLLFDGSSLSCSDIRVHQTETETGPVIRVTSPMGRQVAQFLDPSPARIRFLERTGTAPAEDGFVNRAGLLDRLHLFQATPEERQLNKHAVKTTRQTWEESFWYRLAYHCVREPGDSEDETRPGTFHPAVNKATGELTLVYRYGEEHPVVRVIVPRERVEQVLKLLRERFPEQEDLQIFPIPLKSIFLVTQDTELDMLVRPVIRTLQVKRYKRYCQNLAKYRYGDLAYVRELGVMAELERLGQERKFRSPKMLRLSRGKIDSFYEEHPEEENEGTVVLDEPLRGLEIFKDFDYIQISAEALERSWYWLAVEYGFGDQSISLEDILKGKKQGLPYLETPQGWIDLSSPMFDELEGFRDRIESRGRGTKRALRLSPSELLRFRATTGRPLRVAGEGDRAAILDKLLDLEPTTPFEPHEGLTSKLRPYQQIGVNWLRYLFENRLAGLLCDDMGLGKTHQTMALMTSLRAFDDVQGAFLVVCPTTVISHWRNKIREFAPGLEGFVYHGPERDFAEALRIADVIITSYGILRNDQDEFAQVTFPLAVFDEIQHIKNRDTLGYEAAAQLEAEVKIGLT
ncbi:MAG: SNF2-related protein, partial [Thermoanaerobaculia bacterium]